MAAAFGLILYAASIVSNAFGSPVFSFFQLSYSVAHGVVLYSAVNLAVFLGLGVLIIGVYDTLKGGVAVDSGSQAAEEGEGSGQVLADTAWADLVKPRTRTILHLLCIVEMRSGTTWFVDGAKLRLRNPSSK